MYVFYVLSCLITYDRRRTSLLQISPKLHRNDLDDGSGYVFSCPPSHFEDLDPRLEEFLVISPEILILKKMRI